MMYAGLVIALHILMGSCCYAIRSPDPLIVPMKMGARSHRQIAGTERHTHVLHRQEEEVLQASRPGSGSRKTLQLGTGTPTVFPTVNPGQVGGFFPPVNGAFTPVPVEQRVIFNPVRDEVNDYLLHQFVGIVNLAEADPMLVINALTGSAGIYAAYEPDYDYDQGITETIIGPSAKASWKAGALLRGIGGTRGEVATQASAQGGLLIDKTNANAVEFTQNVFANLRGSLLNVINSAERRASDSVTWLNPFLFDYPAVGFKDSGKK